MMDHYPQMATLNPNECHGEHHGFRMYVGDEPPPGWWDGQRCFCGKRMMREHTCVCGHKHIMFADA